jgi:Na+/H+-translocating membrane pyrophosphatase
MSGSAVPTAHPTYDGPLIKVNTLMTPWAQVSVGLGASIIAAVVVVVFTILVMLQANGHGDPKTGKGAKAKLVRIGDIVHAGAKNFLYVEYAVLAGFVGVTAVALVFMLMKVDYSTGQPCVDTHTLDYTPYFIGAVCDDYAWKEYTAGVWTAICFVVGASFSAAAGFAGMFIATKANTRTAIASNHPTNGFQNGLAVAFRSGAVMSFSVIALGLSGVSMLYCIFSHVSRDHVWDYVSGFGAGGSAIALFARVGGGIYTKAADCGADLVGKVEAGFDEDSPHNPAVIADNIGDNVGDVAGMGADLFESYVGSIIAAAAIGNNISELEKMSPLGTVIRQARELNTPSVIQAWRNNAQALPFWIAGCGVFASVVGVLLTRAWYTPNILGKSEWAEKIVGEYDHELKCWQKGHETHTMTDTMGIKQTNLEFWGDEVKGFPFYMPRMSNPEPNDERFVAARDRAYGEYKMDREELLGEYLLWSLRAGVGIASVISMTLSLVCCIVLFGSLDWFLPFRLWFCILAGLVAGLAIGGWTEYCTAFYPPVKSISKQGLMSPATVIIQGLGVGMISCVVPCIAIVIAIIICDKCASFYGISIAAVGMLSTLGVTLATDAYGPVADNAGGLAEMCSELSLGEILAKLTDLADKLTKEKPNVDAATRKIILQKTQELRQDFGAEIGSDFPAISTAVNGDGDIVAALVADLLAIRAFGALDGTSDAVEDALEPIHEMVTAISEDLGEMLQPEINENVRDVTDALDALGNTTAATGKGFAIGSAVLTSSGLIAAYINSANIRVINLAEPIVVAGLLIGAMLPFLFAALTMLSVGRAAEMIILQVRLQLYEIMAVAAKPNGVTSDSRWSKEYTDKCLIACKSNNSKYEDVAAAFSAFPPTAQGDVQRWAAVMKVWRFDGRADEVKEILDLNDEFLDDMYVHWASGGKPRSPGDYFKDCTVIATRSSLAEMVSPGAIAVLTPPIVGFLMGRLALAGLLIGALSSGFMLAITMSNAGGAWDNAKKYVEKGNFGGKYITDDLGKVVYDVNEAGIKKKRKNPVHDANVIGDTVGDPFKDTSGPSLNILIKLMSVMSLVLAPRFAQLGDDAGFQWDSEFGGAWWIAVLLLIALVAIVIASNAGIWWVTKQFKTRLTDKKSDLDKAEGINADAPAMSPARVKKESQKQKTIEMVENPITEEATVVGEEEAAAPVEEEPAAGEAAAPVEEAAAPAEEAAAPAEEAAAPAEEAAAPVEEEAAAPVEEEAAE